MLTNSVRVLNVNNKAFYCNCGVSGKAGHGQDTDTNSDANLDTDLNISFCHADFIFVNFV